MIGFDGAAGSCGLLGGVSAVAPIVVGNIHAEKYGLKAENGATETSWLEMEISTGHI